MFSSIVIIGLAILAYSLFKFSSALSEDRYELEEQSLAEKFSTVVHTLNQAAFNGQGKIVPLDQRSFNLWQQGKNQIINFHYSTGHLSICWKYKYLQKELVHERQFDNVRNLSLLEQQQLAERMIQEMRPLIAQHQQNVLLRGREF
ncbi:hypothetical protein [Saprospira grandis]|uniref:Uncharacterized protein n=1 Tax=Saprospira grandis (strain Lewin) TaxID=984262 RepID=H6L7D1_SAPGL|nr:hypothetical protein [Saprospira grandis]AFC26803.1 hypothetical protein SGRA_4088 [Saprospira grandis str. Lewin]